MQEKNPARYLKKDEKQRKNAKKFDFDRKEKVCQKL